MPESQLTLESRVRQNPAVLSAEVGESVVLLHAERNAYFDTESVGARIWMQLSQPTTVGAVCEALRQEYDVEPSTC